MLDVSDRVCEPGIVGCETRHREES